MTTNTNASERELLVAEIDRLKAELHSASERLHALNRDEQYEAMGAETKSAARLDAR